MSISWFMSAKGFVDVAQLRTTLGYEEGPSLFLNAVNRNLDPKYVVVLGEGDDMQFSSIYIS